VEAVELTDEVGLVVAVVETVVEAVLVGDEVGVEVLLLVSEEVSVDVGEDVGVVEAEVVGVLMSQSKNVPSTNDTCALFNAATVLAQVLSSINMPREQSTCADASLVG
jgi:hypothetical protein